MSKLEDFFGAPGGAGTDPDAVNKYAANRVMPGSYRTTKTTAQAPILQVVFPTVPTASLVTIRGYLTCSKATAEHHDFTLTGVQAPISGVTRSDQSWTNPAGRVLDFNIENATTIPATTLRFKLGYNSVKKPLLEISGHVLTTVGGGQLVITSISYSDLTDETAPKSDLSFAEVAVSSIATVPELITKNAANEKHKHAASDIQPTLIGSTVDLNTLKTPGRYYQNLPLATTWQSLNYPFAPPCSVVIEKTNGVVQIVHGGEASPGATATRATNSSNVFQAWSYGVNTDKKDLFIYRGKVTTMEGTNSRLPGHYDVDTGNLGPYPTIKGHMHVTSNGIVTGAGSFVQQTIYYHNGYVCTRRIVDGIGSSWDIVHVNNQVIDNKAGIRVTKASSPFYEWHIPDLHAFMSYLDNSGKLLFGSSNGAGTMSATSFWTDATGVIVVNGAKWATAWAHSFAAQYTTIAPLHVEFGAVNGASDYYPIVRGKSSATGFGYTTQVELGMLRSGGGAYAKGVLLVGSGEAALPQAIYYFDTAGNISMAGEMTFKDYTITCDRKFKKEIETIKNPLEKLQEVGGYTFLNQDEEDSGLISNEWEWLQGATKRKPLMDKHGNYVKGEDYLALRIKGPVGFLLECIKAQQEIIETQGTKLARIEKLLNIEESDS